MEVNPTKHCKGATNLFLLVDHDSGYVDGMESSNSNSSGDSKSREMNEPVPTPQNFLLSEDALLEKPEFSYSLARNLPCALNPFSLEGKSSMFFSPEVINCSVQSQSGSTVYDELESQTSSNDSVELLLEAAIVVSRESLVNDSRGYDAGESDMSLDQSFESKITRNSMTSGSTTSLGHHSAIERDEPENRAKSDNSESTLSATSHTTPGKSMTSSTMSNSCSKAKERLTLVFSKSDSTNNYSVKRKYPSMTPDKRPPSVDPCISPDLFEDNITDDKPTYFELQAQDRLSGEAPPSTESYASILDQKLLKRTMKGMSGVLPPPSVTVIHLSVNDILGKIKQNQRYHFWSTEAIQEEPITSLNSSSESSSNNKSLLLNADLEEAKNTAWPNILDIRCHGLHYNCGKTSEEIVDLCDKYQKRFVSAETQSTCTVFETHTLSSSSKRRMTRSKWGAKSPGRRLSHLARRRITFSSASLQAGGSSLVGSRARQILVDAKKIDLLSRHKSPRKTPKKTPSKSPKLKTRTPSSSAKKKLAMRFRKLTGEIQKSAPSTSNQGPTVQRTLFRSPEKASGSSKRALFQSPSRDSSNSSLFASSGSHEKPQLRRALFASPRKGTKSPLKHQLKFGFEKKRKRSESDDGPVSKFPRSFSTDVKPSTSNVSKPMTRCQSEMNISLNRTQSATELSEGHKKKLLWAVNGALQSQNITNSHPQWKMFASVLIRVTRRFYSNQMAACGLAGAKSEVGTTERMQRIARYHVISVVKGKSVDEIVNEHLKSRTKVQRPQGYIPPDDFNEPRLKVPSSVKENVLQDRLNTMESWEKKRIEQTSKPPAIENKIERIRKVINFGDDR